MKKYFLGAAALLALTACSNDETVDLNQDGNVISFAVTASNPSRAATGEVFHNDALPTDFTVYAAYAGNTYFQNETFTKQGETSNYNSANTHYWPAVEPGKEVTFVAFRNAGDHSTNFTWNSDVACTLRYTVPATAATQTDFIYAVAKSQRPTTTGGQVALNFRHALAQVVFKAKVTNPNLYVEIAGVSVCNAKNTGIFTFPFANVTDTNHEDDQEGAFTFDDTYTQGSWSAQTGKVNYVLSFGKVDIANGHTENLTAYDQPRKTDANTLLLLPQNTAAWNLTSGKPASQDGAYFLVKCRIRNVANGTSVDTARDVYLWGSNTEYKEVAIPATFNWEQGKKYIITFVFGNGNGGYNPEPDTPEPVLVPISFTVSVDDFAKVTGDVEMDEPTPAVP